MARGFRSFSVVSNTRQASHLNRCSQGQDPPAPPQLHTPIPSQVNQDLPTFEEVCQLNHPTLRCVPAKAKPAFARALSAILKDVILWYSEEAWLKLLMLPKCVLPSLKRRGNHVPHTSIESLCNMWLHNDLATLWTMTKNRTSCNAAFKDVPVQENHNRLVNSAVSLGMMGKACHMLLSSGIAPNNETTWHLLQAKHPTCLRPVVLISTLDPVSLGSDFDILPILHSFPKGTSAGPSSLFCSTPTGCSLCLFPYSHLLFS